MSSLCVKCMHLKTNSSFQPKFAQFQPIQIDIFPATILERISKVETYSMSENIPICSSA